MRSACAFAESYAATGDAQAALIEANRAWETTTGWYTSVGEQDDPAFRRVFGDGARLVDLVGVPAADERWTEGVGTRFGQLALRVWLPLLTSGSESRVWV